MEQLKSERVKERMERGKEGMDFIRTVREYILQENEIIFQCDTYGGEHAWVSFSFSGHNVVHVKYWFKEEKAPAGSPVLNETPFLCFQFEESDQAVWMKKDDVRVTVNKTPYFFQITRKGRIVFTTSCNDFNVDGRYKTLPAGYSLDKEGDFREVWETVQMYSDEVFYGLGESFLGFDRRGRSYRCWNEDALSTTSKRGYKPHPFYISSKMYAVLLNSYSDSTFDMGEHSGVSLKFSVRDSMIDYFIVLGEDYGQLLHEYLLLKRQEIPCLPDWAFGLWMSRCAYTTRAEVEDMLLRAEELNVAVDVVNLDAWQDNAQMGTWTWDAKRFPDPEGMIADMKKKGIRICLWMFPYVFEGSTGYDYAKKNGFLVLDNSGHPAAFQAMADAPAKCFAFDFTNPTFLQWYREKAIATMRMGVDAVKTDFSEALPENCIFWDQTDGIRGHNRYTYLYAKTVFECLSEVKQETGEAPMIWCRSGHVLSHATPGAWAGDSDSKPGDHVCILHGGLGLAASGIPFWGFDMGGFYNTGADFEELPPKTEDYNKSIQFGLFSPLSRLHGKTPREPWQFGEETLHMFNRYNRLRHSLLPYLTGTAAETVQTGMPVMRPLPFEFPLDVGARKIGDEYMLGHNLLVAPQFDKLPFSYYLPEGAWANLWTGEWEKSGWHTLSEQPWELPIFLRNEAAIPYLMQAVGNVYENRNNGMGLILCFQKACSINFWSNNEKYSVNLHLDGYKLRVETKYPAISVVLYTDAEITDLYFNTEKLEQESEWKIKNVKPMNS